MVKSCVLSLLFGLIIVNGTTIHKKSKDSNDNSFVSYDDSPGSSAEV